MYTSAIISVVLVLGVAPPSSSGRPTTDNDDNPTSSMQPVAVFPANYTYEDKVRAVELITRFKNYIQRQVDRRNREPLIPYSHAIRYSSGSVELFSEFDDFPRTRLSAAEFRELNRRMEEVQTGKSKWKSLTVPAYLREVERNRTAAADAKKARAMNAKPKPKPRPPSSSAGGHRLEPMPGSAGRQDVEKQYEGILNVWEDLKKVFNAASPFVSF